MSQTNTCQLIHRGDTYAGRQGLPYNPSEHEAVAVLARTDPNEQESVVLRPDLEDKRP